MGATTIMIPSPEVAIWHARNKSRRLLANSSRLWPLEALDQCKYVYKKVRLACIIVNLVLAHDMSRVKRNTYMYSNPVSLFKAHTPIPFHSS